MLFLIKLTLLAVGTGVLALFFFAGGWVGVLLWALVSAALYER